MHPRGHLKGSNREDKRLSWACVNQSCSKEDKRASGWHLAGREIYEALKPRNHKHLWAGSGALAISVCSCTFVLPYLYRFVYLTGCDYPAVSPMGGSLFCCDTSHFLGTPGAWVMHRCIRCIPFRTRIVLLCNMHKQCVACLGRWEVANIYISDTYELFPAKIMCGDLGGPDLWSVAVLI